MSTQVFLINLEKDRDRLESMTAQLAALSIPFERVEAVYGTKMPEWIKPYFLDQFFHWFVKHIFYMILVF